MCRSEPRSTSPCFPASSERSTLSSPATAALEAVVLRTLQERALFRNATRVLVACSGGPDSQALLHALHGLRREHKCELVAASVNHGLRAGAGHDVSVAASLAAQLGVEFVAIDVRVEAGASLQAQARAARYAALLECAEARGAQRIAVGHTLDDQAETVLARLIRGTGLGGLAAIEPARPDGVVRPLIDVRRSQTHDYVEQRGIAYVRDPSNLDERYLRTRIRSHLLPWLAAENPAIAVHLAHLADDARENAAVVQGRLDSLIDAARSDISVLRDAAGAERRGALKRWVELAFGVSLRRQHVLALERMLWVGGEVRLPGEVTARLDDEKLVFEPVSKRGRGR